MSKVTILTKPNRIVIASKGVQGPPGPAGADGDLTPELEQARDDAVQAAADAAGHADSAQDASDAALGAASAAAGSAAAAATSAGTATTAATTATGAASTATGAADRAQDAADEIPRSYATRAGLPAASGFSDGYTVWVNNDATAANNGTWAVFGGQWVQSADRVTGLEGRLGSVEGEVKAIPVVQREQGFMSAALGTLDIETSVTAESGLVVVPADAVHSYAPLSFSGRVSHAPDIAGGTLIPSEIAGVVSKDSADNVIDTVSLSPGVILRSTGTVADTMTAEGVITRRVLRVILDGSENWAVRTSGTDVNTIALQGTIVNNLARGSVGGYSGLTNRIPFAQVHNTSDIEGITVAADSSRFLLRINRSRLATQDVAGVKAWLAANPIEVFATASVPTVEKSGHRMILVKAGGTVSISSSVPPLAELRVVTGSKQIESLQHSSSYTEAAIAASGLVSLVNGESGSVSIPSDSSSTYSDVSIYGSTTNVPNISGGTLSPSIVSGVQSRDSSSALVDSITFDSPQTLRSAGEKADVLRGGALTRNVVRILLDGSRTWQVRSVQGQVETLAVQSASSITGLAPGSVGGYYGYSDRFKFGPEYSASDEEGMTVAVDSPRLYLRINRDRLATQDVAGVKAWLAANPIEVFAVAMTPSTEQVGMRRVLVSAGGTVSAVGSGASPAMTASVIAGSQPYSMKEDSLYFSVPLMPQGAPMTTVAMYAEYSQIESDHPEYVSSSVLGLDGLGNELREYVFSEPPIQNDFGIVKKKIGITSGVHGNEKGPATGLLRFMQALAKIDGGSTLLAKIRATFDFHIIPVACPSGWNTHLRNNHNNVNINRNFTTAWNGGGDQNPGPSPASELETQIIESWMASRLFDYFLDCHWSGQGGSTLAWNVVPVGSTKEHEMRKAFADAMHLLGVKWPRRYSSFPAGLPFGLSTTYPELAQAQTQAASYGSASMLLEMAGPITYAESSSVGPVTLTCAAEVIGNVIHAIGKLEGV